MTPATAHPLPRFWIDTPLSPGAEIELPETAARHVAALRLREGDGLILFDGAGGEHEAALLRIVRGRCTARVGARRDVNRESPLAITLALGISTGDRMDYALQKAVELGVARILPLATERSVVHLSRDRADRRLAHWRGIAVAACEQCGRNRVPRIEPVAGLDVFLGCPPEGLKLLLAPDAARRLSEMGRSDAIVVLIGPEGGLSAHEREAALAAGFVALRFGPRILRTETAPLAAIAAIQALWGDC
jgi:16S rRNA (uracil1498-N3)-methyltransferase